MIMRFLVVTTLAGVAATGCNGESNVQPVDRTVMARISGMIVDSSGAAVLGASVQAVTGGPDGDCPGPMDDVGPTRQTDSEGRYEFVLARFGADRDRCVRLSVSPDPDSGLVPDTVMVEMVRFAGKGGDSDDLTVDFVLSSVGSGP